MSGNRSKSSYITTCRKFFGKWKDEDFYGPKAKHVYFYGPVDQANVHALRTALAEARKDKMSNSNVKSNSNLKSNSTAVSAKNTKSVVQKPLCIHLHSPGGDAELGIALLNFLREIKVPVAVIIDGYACSAITPMLIAAPYRVMHRFNFCMIHEGSTIFHAGDRMKESEHMFLVNQYMQKLVGEYYRIYKEHTKLPEAMLRDMLQRDLFMDASTCAKYRVVDRVLKLARRSVQTTWKAWDKRLNTNSVRDPRKWMDDYTHIFNYKNAIEHANANSNSNNSNNVHPMLSIVRPLQDALEARETAPQAPIVLHTNLYLTPRTFMWFDAATLMPRINLSQVPVIGVIDSNIDILQAIPVIMSHQRLMYENTYVSVRLVFDHRHLPTWYYHDIKSNTESLRRILISLLREYTKFPAALLKTLFDKHIILSAADCKKYGLVDHIIETIDSGSGSNIIKSTSIKKKLQGGGCSGTCSHGLPFTQMLEILKNQ